MLIWLFRYLKGFVRIRVLGYSPERFLNLWQARRIVLWDLQNVGNEYEMNLSIRDFRKIRPLVKKARAHVTVTERHGLPFFLHRNRKRKMFPVGMLACCMLLYVLSLFIWDIRIEGNRARSTDVLLTYLAEEQIVHGMRKRDVDCKEIQTMLRIHFPDLTWVSARVTGTQLLIRVRENQDLETEQQEAANKSESSDLVARPGRNHYRHSGAKRHRPGAARRRGGGRYGPHQRNGGHPGRQRRGDWRTGGSCRRRRPGPDFLHL